MTQQNFIQNATFNDFDDYRSTTKAWDVDFRQLDRGPFHAEIKQAFIGPVQFTSTKLGRNMEQRGNPPKNLFTFAVLADPTPLVWRKRITPDYFIMLFAPGSEIDAVVPSGFNVFTFSLSETHIAEVLHSLELPEQRRSLGNKDIFACSRATWEKLADAFNQLDQMVFSSPAKSFNTDFYQQFEYELPRILLTSLTDTQQFKPPSFSRHKRGTFSRVIEYIEANKNEPLSVKDLCRIGGVTERALEYSFNKYLGVSPRTYLKALRLNGLRSELRNADPAEKKVSDIANQWSFWHMGKLAADYRTFFGELPSETLRR